MYNMYYILHCNEMVNGEKYKDIFTVVKWIYYCACNVHKFADDTNLHIFNAICIFYINWNLRNLFTIYVSLLLCYKSVNVNPSTFTDSFQLNNITHYSESSVYPFNVSIYLSTLQIYLSIETGFLINDVISSFILMIFHFE